MSSRLNDPAYIISSWPLNNHADDVVRGNDGTWTVEAYAAGPFGKSAGSFDGADSKVNINSTDLLQNLFKTGGTICCFVVADSDGEGNEGKIASKITGFFVDVRNEAAGSMDIMFVHDFSTTDGNWETTATELDVGIPTHIAWTYDASDVANDPICYINGSAVGVTETQAPVGSSTDSTSDLVIGNYDNQSRTFDGMIWGVRCYSVILTGDEVMTLFRRGHFE